MFRRQSSASATADNSIRPEAVEPSISVKTNDFGWSEALRFHGSIIPRVALPVILVCTWATFWYLINRFFVNNTLVLPATLITLISLVLSLLLVFRTNTAYERYWDGRKLWGSLLVVSRNLARIIWLGVEQKSEQDLNNKKAAIKLILAFLVATKNHLRMEYGLKDSKGRWRTELLQLIPQSRRMHMHTVEEFQRKSREYGSAYANVDQFINIPASLTRIYTNNSAATSVQMPPEASLMAGHVERTNLPIDISHLLSAYILSQRNRDRLDVPQFANTLIIMSTMIDVLTNLERILMSPIPVAYIVHIKQALYIYLAFLPFQLFSGYGAFSILIVAVTAFTMLGVEYIGAEIENPFGYDKNDLPLDMFVLHMREELEILMSTPPVSFTDWELTSAEDHQS